jgi:predicted TPR repeat methyltransferase
MELTLEQALQKGIEAHKAGKVQEADQYYTAILQAQPKHPDANHNMGVLAVGVGKLDQALPFLKTALEANPSIEQFWLSYIDALVKLGKLADAKAVLDQAKNTGVKGDAFDQLEKRLGSSETKNSDNQDPSLDQQQSIINLYSQGKLQQALKQAKTLLQQFPNSSVLYNICGACSKGLGQFDDAIEAYNKAVAIKPDYAEAYNNMGNALREQGQLNAAIAAYKKVLSINPNVPEAYNNMGLAVQEKGKLEEAIKFYHKAIALKANNAEAHYNMGNAFNEKIELAAAKDCYIKALYIKPDFAEAHHNLGNTLREQGNLAAAIESYAKVLTIKPDFAQAYRSMGNAYQAQGNLDTAIDYYTKALEIKPDFYEVSHFLSALTGKTTSSPPKKYVEDLFDRYAKNFENSLVKKLEYKIPKIISNLVVSKHGKGSMGAVLDMGCGTGLLGAELRKDCTRLTGIDLSKKMLAQARKREIYDSLSHTEIVQYLSDKELDFDYFVSTDVFIYVGDLSEVFRLIKCRNKRSGKLVFSTEHTEVDDFQLEQTGRYSHSESYIKSLCSRFDYSMVHFSKAQLRKEKEQFLVGGLYILSF